jgi:hypothetical protein
VPRSQAPYAAKAEGAWPSSSHTAGHQYLTSISAHNTRAIFADDPPSVTAAYNSTLYKAAPYFANEKAVYAVVTPRPVMPVYPSGPADREGGHALADCQADRFLRAAGDFRDRQPVPVLLDRHHVAEDAAGDQRRYH